eukprot:Tamp_27339.p2 GENE.Tamp_27339~~Tamp_27339.p2  ORF type:complete len:102 (+),score=4.73 Tamp_27339:290-595(+)
MRAQQSSGKRPLFPLKKIELPIAGARARHASTLPRREHLPPARAHFSTRKNAHWLLQLHCNATRCNCTATPPFAAHSPPTAGGRMPWNACISTTCVKHLRA